MVLYTTTADYNALEIFKHVRPQIARITIAKRVPIIRGAAYFCQCGGRILKYSDGYECTLCNWDHWTINND